jgi:hypothetical protein
MMTLRRLFALLTSVTMLHLTVVSGDPACATHGAGEHHAGQASGAGAMPGAMPMDGHAMPMAEVAGATVTSAATVATLGAHPCEIPAQQHCCEALVGCSVDSAAAGEPLVLVAGLSPATRISAAPDDLPASFAPAPEPPPPKA